ncbi:19241_t:CDS:2 [Funneliformis geosporum]|nr:19241_t:CDS:2 [Funneliformis geosporum]
MTATFVKGLIYVKASELASHYPEKNVTDTINDPLGLNSNFVDNKSPDDESIYLKEKDVTDINGVQEFLLTGNAKPGHLSNVVDKYPGVTDINGRQEFPSVSSPRVYKVVNKFQEKDLPHLMQLKEDASPSQKKSKHDSIDSISARSDTNGKGRHNKLAIENPYSCNICGSRSSSKGMTLTSTTELCYNYSSRASLKIPNCFQNISEYKKGWEYLDITLVWYFGYRKYLWFYWMKNGVYFIAIKINSQKLTIPITTHSKMDD